MTEERDALISRWFDAPIAMVWRAFVDPDQVAKWYGPEGVNVARESVLIEARVDGPWALTMVIGDRAMPLSGTVTAVHEPHLLVVTDAMPDGTKVTMTVELTEENGGTRLQLRQGPFPAAGATGATGAWGQAMDKLARTLAEARPSPGRVP
jgi:uncharacterized protein YndB with AHSA1/START domain